MNNSFATMHPSLAEEWSERNLPLTPDMVEETAEYSGLGRNKLRQLSDNEKCPSVLWVRNKRLIKRRELDEYTG